MLATRTLLPSRVTFFSTLEPTTSTGDCAICTEPLSSCAVRLHGTHTFCTDCARAWLVDHTTCPLCRAELFAPHDPSWPPAPDALRVRPDHGAFLADLCSAVHDRAARFGSFWFIRRGDDVLDALVAHGDAWAVGAVAVRESSERAYGEARARARGLSSDARRVDASGVRVAVVAYFAERVVGALRAGRWSGPECHPLTWHVFGVLFRLLGEGRGALSGKMTAEALEDVVEERVWRAVRVPGSLRRSPGDDWYRVAGLEERGELPRGCRAFVLEMIEEIMMAHEDDAPSESAVVERREPAL